MMTWVIKVQLVRNNGESTMKNNKIKPQETWGFNVENPPNAEGKNHERQLANLHYIGCMFITPNDGLQVELTKRGANPKGYMNRTAGSSAPRTPGRPWHGPTRAPSQASGDGPPLCSSEVSLFLCNKFGSQYNNLSSTWYSSQECCKDLLLRT